MEQRDDRLGSGSSVALMEVIGRPVLDASLLDQGFAFGTVSLDRHSKQPLYGSIVYRAEARYLKFEVDCHPLDIPMRGNVILGVGPDTFPDSDWNTLALWQLARRKEAAQNIGVYELEGATMRSFFLRSLRELLEYGRDFLDNDLELFFEMRTAQNRTRQGYMVYAPGRPPQAMDLGEQLRRKYSAPNSN